MASKSVLAQFLDLGLGTDSGSFSLSESHFNIFVDQIVRNMNEMIEVYNADLIPKMIDYNFSSKKYPRLEYAPLNKLALQMLQNIFSRIATARFMNLNPEMFKAIEQQMSDMMGLGIDFSEIEEPDLRERETTEAPNDSSGGDE